MFLGCGGEIATKNKLIVVRGVSLNGYVPHDVGIISSVQAPENADLTGKVTSARTPLPNGPLYVSRRSSKQSEELSQLVQGEVEKKKRRWHRYIHLRQQRGLIGNGESVERLAWKPCRKASDARGIPRTFVWRRSSISNLHNDIIYDIYTSYTFSSTRSHLRPSTSLAIRRRAKEKNAKLKFNAPLWS